MKSLKNIKLFYFNMFFHNLIFAYVVERLFWEQRGMSILMVVYAEIIYATTFVILELPTGLLADRWSKKKMLVISEFLAVLEWVLIINANGFWDFALVVFLAGISGAMKSGSQNALIYETLKENSKEHEYEKVLGIANACDFSAALIAALCGSFLATMVSIEFNYYLSIISMTVSFLATLLYQDIIVKSSNINKLSITRMIKESINVFRSKANITLVITTGMFIGACVNYIDEFWQIYFRDLGIPIYLFGLFSALLTASRIPGSLLADKLMKKYSYKKILNSSILIFFVSFIVLGCFKSVYSVITLLLIGAVAGSLEPIVSGYLHHRIDSSKRATIDSCQSLILKLSVMIVGLVFGYFSGAFNIFVGFFVVGLVIFIYFVFFNVIEKNILI